MSPLPLVVNIGMHMLLFGPQHHKTAFTLQTAHILRPWSHRCDARQGIQPSEAECTESQRPEKTFIERLCTPKCKCFEYCLHIHMHIESGWSGSNSAKTARQLNISRETQTCQSTQKGLWWSHNFIFQMSMKLNDFRDTLLNASILYPFKIDWKSRRRCVK